MTLTALITLNAVPAALVVYGVVWLLGSAIGADHDHQAPAAGRHAQPDEHRRRIAA